LVTVGEPKDFWMITLRPRGPSVTFDGAREAAHTVADVLACFAS
jgi:hypothetical protein